MLFRSFASFVLLGMVLSGAAAAKQRQALPPSPGQTFRNSPFSNVSTTISCSAPPPPIFFSATVIYCRM